MDSRKIPCETDVCPVLSTQPSAVDTLVESKLLQTLDLSFLLLRSRGYVPRPCTRVGEGPQRSCRLVTSGYRLCTNNYCERDRRKGRDRVKGRTLVEEVFDVSEVENKKQKKKSPRRRPLPLNSLHLGLHQDPSSPSLNPVPYPWK